MIPFNDTKKAVQELQEEIFRAIELVVQRGIFLFGPETEAFEKEFAQFCGVAHAVSLASGTDALRIALTALSVSTADEVITTPNTAMPTVSAISATGAKPVFVDINPQTLMLDEAQLLSKISKRTKAIIPVHLFGFSVDMDPVLSTAQTNNLSVIEDACQAHGALYHSKRVGSMGAFGCFSFYPTKNLGALGDAGMLVTSDETLARKARLLANYGSPKRDTYIIKGTNSRMDELQAAVLRVKLKKLDAWNQKRIQLASVYIQNLSPISEVTLPHPVPDTIPTYHLYVIRVKDRDRLRAYLSACKIETSIHYPIPIHLQESYKDLAYAPGAFPVSEQVSQEILSLPMSPFHTQEQILEVCEKIQKFYL